MDRETLSNRASEQYSRIRSNDEYLHDATHWTLTPDPYRKEWQANMVRRMWDDYIDDRVSDQFRLGHDAQEFYEENHAELYEMAREEMEAAGIPFNFADDREETVYRYGEDIAQLEESSPLNALGAKIVHIAQTHIDHIDQEFAQISTAS